MRVLVHISDLHFGRHDPVMVEALAQAIQGAAPDLVVVSGDLTQRARSREFAAAAAFLARLGRPTLAVPGNHDLPLRNPLRRLLAPFGRFRLHISADRQPRYADDEIAVLGLNTARALALSDGRLSATQVGQLQAAFAGAHAPLRVLVTHHPLLECGAGPPRRVLDAITAADVRMLLAGHRHRAGCSGDGGGVAAQRSVLVVQAGTAVSTRIRGEANSFNHIEAEADHVRVAIEAWTGLRFETAALTAYRFAHGGWCR